MIPQLSHFDFTLLCRLYTSCLQYFIQGRVLSKACYLLPGLHPICRLQYFIQGYDSILFYKTVLFPHFSYKVLGVLPRLVKGLDAILCGENINFLPVQVFIVHPGGENYLYFRRHHIRTRFFRLAQA